MAGHFEDLDHPCDDVDHEKPAKLIIRSFVVRLATMARPQSLSMTLWSTVHYEMLQTLVSGLLGRMYHIPSKFRMLGVA